MAKFSAKPIITGHKRVKAKARRLEERIRRKASRRGIDKGLTPVNKETKQLAPTLTRKYKKSIKKERAKTRGNGVTEGRVSSGHPLAWILEHGTEPHKIRRKKVSRLKFEWDGKTVFATQVQHPGSDGSPHYRPALEQNRNKALSIYFETVKATVAAETAKAALK